MLEPIPQDGPEAFAISSVQHIVNTLVGGIVNVYTCQVCATFEGVNGHTGYANAKVLNIDSLGQCGAKLRNIIKLVRLFGVRFGCCAIVNRKGQRAIFRVRNLQVKTRHILCGSQRRFLIAICLNDEASVFLQIKLEAVMIVFVQGIVACG